MSLTSDPDTATPALGYGGLDEAPDAQQWVLEVSGMTCASCAARIERRLARLEGVTEARVNLATHQALVTADRQVDPDVVVAAVERLGYRARLHQPRQDDDPLTQGAEEGARVAGLWRRLVVALVCGAPLADASMTFALAPQWRFAGWQVLLLVLTVPVVTYSAAGFYRGALSAARAGTSSMDTLIALGIVAATGWSAYAMTAIPEPAGAGAAGWGLLVSPSGSLYLDVAAGVVCFALAGRLWEAKARRSAGSALRALAARTAREATVLRPDGTEARIPAAALVVGNRVLVRPGELVPADGTVTAGACAVDTSALTGESHPTPVGPGDTITGGVVALDGCLEVTATRVGADTTWAQLVELVSRAQHDKAGIAGLTDRISAVFVSAVITLALGTALAWLLLGGADPQHAVQAGIAVLIIACPCALGLATPTALLVAAGRGAELGIFLKGHHGIEVAGAIDNVVLDKTGTLTTGDMAVVGMTIGPDSDPDSLLRVTAALEHASEHPTARALVTAAAARAAPALLPQPVVRGFSVTAGLGVSGWVDDQRVVIGSARLLEGLGLREPESLRAARAAWERQGLTPVMVGVDGDVAGGFAIADTLRPSAADAVAQLHRMGLATVLLSGDTATITAAVAAELGIEEVRAEVLPADKAATITALQAQGRRVAMVGDGINDAPALAAADLGLALLSGTDVAAEAAEMILVGDDLTAIPTAIGLARRTRRTIRGNLAWAFGYNLAAVPVAALGLLNPVIAAAAMALSSGFVLANSLRLRRFTPPPAAPKRPDQPAAPVSRPADPVPPLGVPGVEVAQDAERRRGISARTGSHHRPARVSSVRPRRGTWPVPDRRKRWETCWRAATTRTGGRDE